MLVVRGRLSPEVGAVVQRALEAAADRLYHEGKDNPQVRAAGREQDDRASVSMGQRRADALGLLAESALAGDLDRGAAGDRYQVVVHVDEDVLQHDAREGQSALEDGIHVPAQTARRIACDASRVVMRHGPDGTVRAARGESPAAFDRRYISSAGVPPRSNTAGMLPRRALSAERITGLGATPDFHQGLLDVGRKTRTIPPAIRRALASRDHRCRFPGRESRHCDAHHVLAAAGITIDEDTATPDWYGEQLNVSSAIRVLHLATNPVRGDVPAGTSGFPDGRGTRPPTDAGLSP